MEHQVTDRKALIETLNAAFLRDELEDALRHHWSLHLLEVIRPGKNSRELKYNKEHQWRLLLEPVEAFIAGSDEPAEKFATLKKEDPPSFICNRLIPADERVYSCLDCAVDSNRDLCIECFEQSAHKIHRYKELVASGNRLCDCGDSEAWKTDFACTEHEPPLDLKDVNFNLEAARIRVPKDISRRFTEAIRHALCYVYQVLTFRDGVSVPLDLACPLPWEDPFPFVTILYNNKVHDYDDVIETLTLALECTEKEASGCATLVDDEGRSPVKYGSEDECQRVKKFVKRYSKIQEPLRLDVVQTVAYAHQVFALEVLTWIQDLAEKCEGFRALICDVCLQVSPVGGDHPIVSSFLLEDVRLWKAARRGCYSLFMATFLIFNDARIEFSRLLARCYTQLIPAFISEDHDYYNSCTFNSIFQLFPVPTVARTLFSDGLVEVIVKSFVLFCQSRKNDQGRLSFDRATQPAIAAQFERALYILRDAKKLLNTVPTSHEWTDALRKGFIGTFEQFLQIMVMMEGMDSHIRQTRSYVEYETDCKPAFDMQFQMGGIVGLLQQWCASDNIVLSVCIGKLLTTALTSLHAVVTSHLTSEKIEKIMRKEVAGCFFDCVEYDVSTQFVSIHHPLIRMLAGLVVPALAKRTVLEVPGGRVPIEEHLKLHARELLELPLRIMVLVAQARRGMWHGNNNRSYPLDRQIDYYQDPRWRGEMLDKDIVMMQACAAVIPPDSFLIALLDKFALLPWADETFDATSVEDDLIRQVMCLAEDFLYGLIILVGERFYPGVGCVTEEDCVKNELIHQLCKENMSYSELLKYLPNQEEKFSIDELIKELGVLKKSPPTGEDFFELKTELMERYNLCFYHYNETERSEANDTQRKRRKETWEKVVFAPPCPPPFFDAFSRMVHLLDCNVFIHLLKLTLRRALTNSPRFFFDDQLVQMLYLVGYALHEEKRQRLSNNNNNFDDIDNTNTNSNHDFKFLKKAADAGVFMTLRELRVRSNNETYKNLVEWVLEELKQLSLASILQQVMALDGSSCSVIEPANVIFDVMQFAGLSFGEASGKTEYGYPFEIRYLDVDRDFGFQLPDGSTVSLIEVIQYFLKHVHTQCKNLFGLLEFSLTFTVPSYWRKWIPENNETQLLEAARRSGFTRASFIDSQVAATLGCYLDMKDSKTWAKDILVVDVGAIDITATVSRTQLEDETKTETFTVTGIGLGCNSVDRALMGYLMDQFVSEHRLPLETIIEISSVHRFRMECEKARVSLKTTSTTVLFVPNFAVGYNLHVELTRDTFDDIVGSTIAENVVDVIKQTLSLSGINVESSTKDDLRLFLVGGGSRIPCIQQRMDTEFGTKINSVAVLYCEDAAVIGAARYAQVIALEPSVMKLDIVQHYRDLCDFFENSKTPLQEDGATRLASCRSACTHASARRTLVFFDRMISIIPSMHGISTKTDGTSYCFSIKDYPLDYAWVPQYIKDGRLHNVELTQGTAASLQLKQTHMSMLSFRGTLQQEDLTNTGAFGNFQGRMTTICNPLDLRHPNVVRCLAVGRRAPMRQEPIRDLLLSTWPFGKEYTHMLIDMRMDSDIALHRFSKERGSSLANIKIINKTKQLLDGLSYLHGLKIPFILASLTSSGILVTKCGRTVKIWNILGVRDKSPSQRDFDVSANPIQDLAYAHPDVSNYIVKVEQDHEKCSTFNLQTYMDIWSLGCVVLDMVSRGNHFGCINRHGLPLNDDMKSLGFVRTIMNGGRPLIPSSAPEIIRQLCRMCFERKPDRRTDALGLLTMISQTPENEIDVCSTEEPKPKQTSAFLFTVSKDVWFEVKWNTYLARGSYGDVYMVDIPNTDIPESSISNNVPEAVHHALRDRRTLALKVLKDCELDKSKRDLLVSLSHNHVVMYVCTGMAPIMPGDIYAHHLTSGILMEYYTGGDLNQHAQQQDLSATEILEFARQIASGLVYLHDTRDMEYLLSDCNKPVAHGDLKGQNIFLTSEAPATAKIGDLDSSAILKKGQTNMSGLRIKEGTLTHMSPEMLAYAFGVQKATNSHSTNIGRATDIYSVGCIILEMFGRGVVSYSNEDGSKVEPQAECEFARGIVSLDVHPDLSVAKAKNIPLDFLQLLQQCLKYEPLHRPKASDLFTTLTEISAARTTTPS